MAVKVKIVKLKLDRQDYEAIQEAIAIRRSGLFRMPDGELSMPDGESDSKGAALAEICRQWVEDLSRETIQAVLDKKAEQSVDRLIEKASEHSASASILAPEDKPVFAAHLDERTNGESAKPRKPSPDPNKPL